MKLERFFSKGPNNQTVQYMNNENNHFVCILGMTYHEMQVRKSLCLRPTSLIGLGFA